tara:strand:+ start:634 stop:738 length:105 start_codon:yes stop_codon:yes gene_type:complete
MAPPPPVTIAFLPVKPHMPGLRRLKAKFAGNVTP